MVAAIVATTVLTDAETDVANIDTDAATIAALTIFYLAETTVSITDASSKKIKTARLKGRRTYAYALLNNRN